MPCISHGSTCIITLISKLAKQSISIQEVRNCSIFQLRWPAERRAGEGGRRGQGRGAQGADGEPEEDRGGPRRFGIGAGGAGIVRS